PTRTVDRVDTIMVVEAIRRGVLPGASLHELADTLVGPGGSLSRGTRKDLGKARKTLLTLCLTGEGTAVRLKGLMEKILGQDEVEILPLGAAGRFDVGERIADLARERRIAAIVGTVDPGYPDIPFIPVEEIVGSGGADLVHKVLGKVEYPSLDQVLIDEFLVPRAPWTTREETIDGLARLMVSRGHVTQAFVTDVYRRELIGPTVLEGGVAIPHGESVHVVKPAIAVANLAEPVDWAGGQVRVVCLLALGSVGQETFKQLYRALQPGSLLERLKTAKSRAEMKEALLAGMGQSRKVGETPR
ncbi:MAG: PTS sugar transporter subunit IIA, partial [Actinobacteria bacterium]|nr:PTS sugar transporter subunit IIA [Actinomycetota bacterium]